MIAVDAHKLARGCSTHRWRVFVHFFLLIGAIGPWVSPANAKDNPRQISGTDSNAVTEWLREIETAVRVHANPLERSIVCRLPYTDVSVRSMSLATGHTKRTITYAATKLQEWGLVKLLPGEGGYPTIVPANEKSRELMRSWADQWCAQDSDCSVAR